jgi:phage tail protein X
MKNMTGLKASNKYPNALSWQDYVRHIAIVEAILDGDISSHDNNGIEVDTIDTRFNIRKTTGTATRLGHDSVDKLCMTKYPFTATNTIRLEFNNLDYGCYRDIQRHRTVRWAIPEYIPEITDTLNEWYTSQYDIETVRKLTDISFDTLNMVLRLFFSFDRLLKTTVNNEKNNLKDYSEKVEKVEMIVFSEFLRNLNTDEYPIDELKSSLVKYIYSKPLATCCKHLVGYIYEDDAEYVLKLRSGDTTHPILRQVVQTMCDDIGLIRQERQTDYTKRSLQDIVQKR